MISVLIASILVSVDAVLSQQQQPPMSYPPSRQILTTYGSIEGRRLIFTGDKQVDAFQGIPYAAPPIGNLRFALPQPHPSWDGVRETKAFGPRGIQVDSFSETDPQSEDNLSLNIFTPVWQPTNSSGFPVLVFIHGGAFIRDSAITYGDTNICEYLVKKDVVVVTLQYRLGLLGFWTTGDGQMPDNLALYDMTFALKWIKDNIAKFNGDVDNISVMGHSAGGDAVDILSISPMSRDLFHKVIPMAGNSDSLWAINENPLEICRQKGLELGVADDGDSNQWINKLRELSADKFAIDQNFETPRDITVTAIGPKYDNCFLPKSIKELRKEAPIKPRLVGMTRSEGLFFYFFDLHRYNQVSMIRDNIATLLSERTFPRNARILQDEAIKKLISLNQKNSKDKWNHAEVESKGDSFLNVAVQKNVISVLEAHPKTPLYFYQFEHYNPDSFEYFSSNLPFMDATHTTDLSYVFGKNVMSTLEWNDDDLEMIEITTRLWTNFAKYGDPNGQDETENILGERWEQTTLDNPQLHLSLSLNSTMQSIFKNGRPLFIASTLLEKDE